MTRLLRLLIFIHFTQSCSHYNMFIHSITYRKGKNNELKTLISTTALAISANTFAVDLASKNTDSYQHIRGMLLVA